MTGAGRGAAYRQASLAEAAWVGANANHRDLQRYLETLDPDREILPPEALAGAMRAAFSGLPSVRRADFLKSKG